MDTIDNKIKKLIKVSVLRKYRSLFVIFGSTGAEKIPTICKLLSRANRKEIHSLWCSKDGSSKPEKKINECDESISNASEADGMINPYYCTYNNLENISHRSFHLAVLQDFDLSSLLAANFILSTVKGGGAVIFLCPNLNSLEDLQSFNLNVKSQTSRFSRRFIQSLDLCPSCIILDEKLNILSSSNSLEKPDDVETISTHVEIINEIKLKCKDESVFTTLLDLCLSGDQAELLFKCLDILKKRTFHAVLSVSSACSRGKSATLGLAIAGSLALNYSNIFISSSNHTNVNVLFQYLLKGLDALQYKEDKDYDLIESANPEFNRALIGLNVFRDHPQAVRFIFPDAVGHKLEQAELVVIDEAASIPLDKLKQLLGPYVVLMASSVCGANSTSPYVYDAMVENLQHTSKLIKGTNSSMELSSSGNSLQKVTLSEPVHYAPDDTVEAWSHHLFCMKSSLSSQLTFGCPETQRCELFCVSRDALFNGSPVSERLLHSLVSIFNQSSYVIQPEDFIKLADSSDSHIFVLLPPQQTSSRKTTPEVLCAILVHLEYEIPTNIVQCGSNVSEPMQKCFNHWNMQNNSTVVRGIHIQNLATHPCYKRMGYGLRAFQLLQEMYEGKCISLDEKMEESCNINENGMIPNEVAKAESPLLLDISEVKLENVEFLCVSFNLTEEVFSFWKKAGFVPLFLTAERSSDTNICFMLKSITEEFEVHLQRNWLSFQNYYSTLLNSYYQSLPAEFALSLLKSGQRYAETKELTKEDIDIYFKPYDMKALERYCQRLQDINPVIHIILDLAKLYFRNYFKDVHIPVTQETILLSFGLQNNSIESVAKKLSLQSIQVIGLLNRTIKKLTNYLTNIIEKAVEKTIVTSDVNMKPIAEDLDEELEEAANEVKKQQEDKLLDMDVSQYAIKGSEDEWQKALFSGRKTLVSIKSIKKRMEIEEPEKNENKKKFKKPMKKKRK